MSHKPRELQLGGPVLRHTGYLFLGLRLDTFAPASFVEDRIQDLFQRIRATPPGPGFDSVLVPGDVEAAHRRSRAEMLPIDEQTLDALLNLAGLTPEVLDQAEDA